MTWNRSYIRLDQQRPLRTGNLDEDSENNLLAAFAAKAFDEAAQETMNIMGYNVIVEEGWIVKVFYDGNKEKIKKIGRVAEDFDHDGK